MSKNYDRFLETYYGKKLIQEHAMNETGIWRVRGEDPNCDLGGHHHEPDLGYLEGTLHDVIMEAVEMANFWAWGGGGRITKESPPSVRKADPVGRAQNLKRIKELETELARLKKEV